MSMDPVSSYLLSVVKREKTNDTRTYREYSDSLSEMGYWLLIRPIGYSREQMPPCKISDECDLIDEFTIYSPPVAGCPGHDVVVEVYAERELT